MSRPGSDDSPGSSPLAAPAAASEDARDQALSLARESVQADVAAFGEEQREQLRLKFKSLDEIEGGFGTALAESFPDFLPLIADLERNQKGFEEMLGGSSEIDKNFKARMEAFDAAADSTRFKMLAKAAGAADAAASGGRNNGKASLRNRFTMSSSSPISATTTTAAGKKTAIKGSSAGGGT